MVLENSIQEMTTRMNDINEYYRPTKSELSAEDQRRLDELYTDITDRFHSFVGYPCTADFDYSPLFRFLEFPINNVGDPFLPSTYRLSTRDFECEVLQWFAELMHAPENNYWGYVTNGGTEGNMYGLYLARELLPNGVVYYSEDTHYSVSKSLRVLRMQHIMIKSLCSGEIDYEDLRETIRIHRDVPPIIFANIGTTMKEGVDRIDKIREIINDLAIPVSYIHCDAALSGMILPFIEDAPVFDFRAGIDSISISGHKLIGSPIPCGVALAKKGNVDRIARSIEYVGTLDTTLSGSRNGITPLILWYALRKTGKDGFRRWVQGSLNQADYAVSKLREIGLDAWRNKFGITVVFPRPTEEIMAKWQIAVYNDYAHIIVMPHITSRQIDDLVDDIKSSMKQTKT
jgi:histidine decarboxylase